MLTSWEGEGENGAREGREEGRMGEGEGKREKGPSKASLNPQIGFFQLALLSFYHFPVVASYITL